MNFGERKMVKKKTIKRKEPEYSNIGPNRDPMFPAAYGKHIKVYKDYFDRPKQKLIALDLGMVYGYAYLNVNKLIYGYHDATPTRYATQMTSALAFHAHLLRMAEEMGRVDAIFFEEVHGTKGQYAMQINGMFLGAMISAAGKINCKIVKGYQVSAIKHYATEMGSAKKKQMIESANLRYGLSLDPRKDIDGNIADAVHLLSLGMEAQLGLGSLSNYLETKQRDPK